MADVPPLKPVRWIGSSRRDVQAFPEPVKDHLGYALFVAQCGGKHCDSKTLRGFGGAGVVEIITDHFSDTFRTVYTSQYEGVIYVLHAFQKKSKSGRATPKPEIDLIKRRLREAERMAKEKPS
jgi:phage-related protein